KEKADVNFTVRNEAATSRYHPHTYHLSREQVYPGLAGLIYVEDDNSEKIKNNLLHTHGVDDSPLKVQDRYFRGEGIVDYEAVKSEDGTRGDHLLLNGALMTKVDTNKRYVRLRLLNASNRTNFKFELSDGNQFFQIA